MSLKNVEIANYKFLITGGTGFIGSKIVQALENNCQKITILSRKKRHSSSQKINYINDLDEENFDYDVVINLSGAPISKRWSQSVKTEIIKSRIAITEKISQKILTSSNPPKLFLSGSAIGIYGCDLEKSFSENSPIQQQNLFSQKLCLDWEEAAKKCQSKTRLILLRTGLVLGKKGGFLQKMLPAFQFGAGGQIGHGQQYLSWIHLSDYVEAIKFLIFNEKIAGAVNLTAPNAETNANFSKTLAAVLRRPCWFQIPEFSLKLIYGQMAEELLLNGQKVLPNQLLQHGFSFKFAELKPALQDVLK